MNLTRVYHYKVRLQVPANCRGIDTLTIDAFVSHRSAVAAIELARTEASEMTDWEVDHTEFTLVTCVEQLRPVRENQEFRG